MAKQKAAKLDEGAQDPVVMLGVLSALETDSSMSQRKLSQHLGIALGLANAYIRRCVRKGLIKVSEVPMQRYAYYLTPTGFSEKARLTSEYLNWSLEFFRRARREATDLFTEARDRGMTRFVLIGGGDFAEVACLSAIDADVEVVGVVDINAATEHCAGRPVFRSISAMKEQLCGQKSVHGVMIAQAGQSGEILELLRQTMTTLGIALEPRNIILPKVLKMNLPPLMDKVGA